MRIIGWVGLLAVLAIGGIWLAGQQVVRNTRAALVDPAIPGPMRARQVTGFGFPAALGVEIRDMGIDGNPALDLPRVRASAPVWRPLDWTARIDQPFVFRLNGLRFAVTGTGATAALDAGFGTGWPLRQAQIDLADPAATYEAAAAPSLAARRATATAREIAPARYHLTGTVADLRLPEGLARSLTPQARFSDVIESVVLDAEAGFDRPFTLAPQDPPVLTALSITDLRLVWDGRAIGATGDITIDAEGRPEGTLTVTVEGWQDWMEFLTRGLLIDDRLVPILTMLGNSMARDGTLHAPLTFRGGRMAMGPVPLGPAPVLVQRQ